MQLTQIIESIYEDEGDSEASIEAKRRGLKSAPYGRFVDDTGKVVGQSRGGKFVPVNEPEDKGTDAPGDKGAEVPDKPITSPDQDDVPAQINPNATSHSDQPTHMEPVQKELPPSSNAPSGTDIPAWADKIIAAADGDLQKAYDVAIARNIEAQREFDRRRSGSRRGKTPFQDPYYNKLAQNYGEIARIIKGKMDSQSPSSTGDDSLPSISHGRYANYTRSPADQAKMPSQQGEMFPHPQAAGVAKRYLEQYGNVEAATQKLEAAIKSAVRVVEIAKAKGVGKKTQKMAKAVDTMRLYKDALDKLKSFSGDQPMPKMGDMAPDDVSRADDEFHKNPSQFGPDF